MLIYIYPKNRLSENFGQPIFYLISLYKKDCPFRTAFEYLHYRLI